MSDNEKSYFDKNDVLAVARGEYFGTEKPKLPMPPMLMVDRIVELSTDGGANSKGFLAAELDITPDMWFFECHFVDDPVMPGCLGLDALWQLTGFYLGWHGATGKGRALGVNEVKFTGQVLPTNKVVRYEIDMKRVINGKLQMAIADGRVLCDGEQIYTANDLRVGIFAADKF
jgi:3-hydroxyacyl-[acyl-carrier protein] dehydratase/trans-2-decenoyl-[acyl-carrier protein] isomerase